jgi:aryl-alcohol dehydrogenase (NADP+)
MSMQYTRLGRTGLKVSRLCLGTMTFGFQCDEATSIAIMDKAFDGGVTFFDTADVYPIGGNAETVGRTEEFVGRWLKGRRERVVLATKCFGRMGPSRWDQGNSRKHVLDAIDASLKRLGTDYVDLYQLHGPDPETPIDETLRALEDVVRSGRARYVGCSNFLAYQVARAIGRSEAMGAVRFDSVQPRYNLLFREIERELLPLCAEEGIGVIPYNPIAGGLLSGKHNKEAGPEEGSRFTLGSAAERYQQRYWHQREFETVEQLRPIAAGAGMPLAQMAVAWVLANPGVTAPIIGASRPEQLNDSLAAIDRPLPAEMKQQIDTLTAEYRRGDAAR